MDKKKFSLIDFFAENKLIHTLLAIVCGFIVGALFMMAMDVSVSAAYGKLFTSIFGGVKFMSYCVVYATPYIVTGLSVAFSFKTGALSRDRQILTRASSRNNVHRFNHRAVHFGNVAVMPHAPALLKYRCPPIS